jgi:hypothetical protein
MSGKTCEPLGLEKPGSRQESRQPSIDSSADDDLGGFDLSEEIVTASSSPLRSPISGNFHRLNDSRVSRQPSPDIYGNALDGIDLNKEIICISSSPPPIPYETRRAQYNPDPPDDTDDVGGSLETVRTKFCHPIVFDYQDETPDGSDPCHFCSCAHFGILGLEERTVEVIDWHNGRGWEEISNGHRGDNIKGTQVCVQCTKARMQIMICPDHAFMRITELGAELDLQAAIGRLVSGDEAAGDRWCSICLNVAAWECCMAQDDGQGEGCGLALCEACVEDLGDCGGSLEIMLQVLTDEPSEARPAGLRADYELLKYDGLLKRYLVWSESN